MLNFLQCSKIHAHLTIYLNPYAHLIWKEHVLHLHVQYANCAIKISLLLPQCTWSRRVLSTIGLGLAAIQQEAVTWQPEELLQYTTTSPLWSTHSHISWAVRNYTSMNITLKRTDPSGRILREREREREEREREKNFLYKKSLMNITYEYMATSQGGYEITYQANIKVMHKFTSL